MHTPSNLRELLQIVSDNYIQSQKEDFAKNPVADLLRNAPGKIISKIISFPNMMVKGSPGMGRWTPYPWIAVIDKRRAKGPQDGVYVVYLFSKDMKRVYLTLNQGVTVILNKHKKNSINILKANANDIRKYTDLDTFSSDNKIDLGPDGKGPLYEAGTIYYKKYNTSQLPTDGELQSDLIKIITFYTDLMIKDEILTSEVEYKREFKNNKEEGKRILVSHYRYERNPTLVLEFKEKCKQERGELRCEACDFSFAEVYGERGEGYIEVHHMVPVSHYTSEQTTLFKDLALVCSNCHRMIHRQMPYLTMDELKDLLDS